MFRRKPSLAAQYVSVVLIVAAATLLLFAGGSLFDGAPFIFYYPAIVVCAWLGGFRAGLLCVVLSLIVAWFGFLPPYYSWSFTDASGPVRLIVFGFAGWLISLLAGRMHEARDHAQAAEARERQQGEQWRVTLSSIGDAVISTDASGQVVFMNAVAEKLTGWTLREAAGRSLEAVFRIVNEDTRMSVENPALRAMREGLTVGLANHTLLISKQGVERPIEDSAAPIRDDADHVVGVVLVFHDVSDRRQVDAKLRESEERLKLALAAGRMGAWEWNMRAGRVVWSPGLEEIHGLQPGTFGGLFEDFKRDIHPDDVSRVLADIEQAVRTRSDYHVQYRIVRPDGKLRWLEAHAVLSFAPDGDPEKLIGVCTDITQRKQGEEERARLLERERGARAEAEAANRAKDVFLATLSHELRTPLQAILGWSSLLGMGKLDAAAVKQAVETIERNARLQAQLVGDLLDMSRIVSGNLALDVQPVVIARTVESAMQAVRPSAEAKRLRLSLHVAAPETTILGDAIRLSQIVSNLLSNAVKFTPEGGRVDVRLEPEGAGVRIIVADTGQGISPEFLPYVFDRFRQGDGSQTRHYGGLGLGLAIVDQLVKLHGGTVKVESPGEHRGARFTVWLPAADADAGPPLREAPDAPHDDRQRLPTLDGKVIMLVEDEASAREVIRAILAQCGAAVLPFGSADEALAALSSHPPDVLVSDIAMPDQSGYELIAKIRALAPEQGGAIPALALTAFAHSDDRARALAAGFQAHVSKPVEPVELAHAVAKLLS